MAPSITSLHNVRHLDYWPNRHESYDSIQSPTHHSNVDNSTFFGLQLGSREAEGARSISPISAARTYLSDRSGTPSWLSVGAGDSNTDYCEPDFGNPPPLAKEGYVYPPYYHDPVWRQKFVAQHGWSRDKEELALNLWKLEDSKLLGAHRRKSDHRDDALSGNQSISVFEHQGKHSSLSGRNGQGSDYEDWETSTIASQDQFFSPVRTSIPTAGKGLGQRAKRFFRCRSGSPKEHMEHEDHLSGSRKSGFKPSVVHDSLASESNQSDISSVFADWGKRALKLGKVAKEIGQSLYPPRPDYLMESPKSSAKERQPGQMWNENSNADADTLHYPDEDESLHLDGEEDRKKQHGKLVGKMNDLRSKKALHDGGQSLAAPPRKREKPVWKRPRTGFREWGRERWYGADRAGSREGL